MKIAVLPVTAFQQNCSLLWCEASGHGVIIDPGGEPERVQALLEHHQVTPQKILLTHGHLDHVGAAPALAQRLGVPIEGPHRADEYWLRQGPAQAEMFGFAPTEVFTPQRWLADGDRVAIGQCTLEVLHCPGHTPGHVVFFSRPDRLAIVGDVLFAGSIGRTDFPGGSHPQLIDSIRRKLFALGDDVRFLPGHGPMSTLGEERRHNPYVSDAAIDGGLGG